MLCLNTGLRWGRITTTGCRTRTLSPCYMPRAMPGCDPFSSSPVSGLPPPPLPLLLLPPSGMFFYWQVGALDAIIAAHSGSSLSLSLPPLSLSFSGASAGSLTAVLAACGVEGRRAAEEAFRVSTEHGLWDRQAGGWVPTGWMRECENA